MTERRKLAKQLSLAALIICGLALGGCGDGGNNSPNDLDDPDPNQAPVCNVVDVVVDVATQEIVVQVEAWDPDLVDFSFGLDLSFEVITATATYTNDVLTSSTGAPIIGNTVFDAAHTNTAPGALTEVRISSTTPVLMMSWSRTPRVTRPASRASTASMMAPPCCRPPSWAAWRWFRAIRPTRVAWARPTLPRPPPAW